MKMFYLQRFSCGLLGDWRRWQNYSYFVWVMFQNHTPFSSFPFPWRSLLSEWEKEKTEKDNQNFKSYCKTE